MDVFYRVFDRDYVAGFLLVYLIYHRGEGRRFPASCRPCHQDEALGFLAERSDDVNRKAAFLEGPYLERDEPDGAAHTPPLHEDVDPETAYCRYAEGHVEFEVLLELGDLLFRQYAVCERPRIFRRERGCIHRHQLVVYPQLHRRVRRYVQVGGILIVHHLQELVYIVRNHPSFFTRIPCSSLFPWPWRAPLWPF